LIPVGVAFAFTDRFTLSLLAFASMQALYVASWDLVGGVSGQTSLGHALPFGCGAYVAAFLSMWGIVPASAAVSLGALAGGAAGGLQGALGARLGRVSLALLTLATAEIAREIAAMLRMSGPGGLLVGGDGGIPTVVFPPGEAGAARLVAAVLTSALIALLWLVTTSLGLAMRTVRADDRLAAASGIDVVRVRLLAFVVAGGAAGVAGAFTATMAGRAAPALLSLNVSLFAVAIARVGGPGTIVGPALAAYAVSLALQWLDPPAVLRLALSALVLIGTGLAAPGSARREGLLRTPLEGPRRA
jgi:branched-chain amino acid transport system permease protein